MRLIPSTHHYVGASAPSIARIGFLWSDTSTSPPTLKIRTAIAPVTFAAVSGGGGGGTSFGVPALTLGTTNADGVATTALRTDASIAVFDTTAPTTSAVGDAAAVGTAAVAARRDHKHGREAFATPSIALGSAAAAGAATTPMRSDATIAAFDTTAPVNQAFGDAAAVGVAAFAARRDHKHGMPTAPSVSSLTDAQIASLADGQVLTWVAAASKWENVTPAGGAAATWTFLASATLGANATTLTTASFTAKKHLMIFYYIAGYAASSIAGLRLGAAGAIDTGNTYADTARSTTTGNATGVATSNGTARSSIRVSQVAISAGFRSGTIFVDNASGRNKHVRGDGTTAITDASTSAITIDDMAGVWANTAQANIVGLEGGGQSLLTNTYIAVFGRDDTSPGGPRMANAPAPPELDGGGALYDTALFDVATYDTGSPPPPAPPELS